jgi:4-amino-4-deoxy-L-arabinose transferase-like glycosyltransferase
VAADPGEQPQHATDAERRRLSALVLVAAFAVASYLFGLDGQHIPKNGDEYAYEHVTRLTAASGSLLPLRSDLPALRNTKPPLLFWQGIASTNVGRVWTLARLRYPSVVYTLLTAALVGAVALRLSGRPLTACTALLCFLAFYGTYRYGRPFLTDAPVTFWLFLPFAVLLLRPAAARSRVGLPVLLGLAIGIGLLYKSFALAVPAGVALAWWYRCLPDARPRSLASDGWKVGLTLSVALATFASWFALDPDPAAVWRDFVLRENAGKFDLPGGYLPRLLWGASSLWSLAFAYPANAGLLALVVLGLFAAGWRGRREQSPGERLLWVLVLVYLLVFAVPSQRSGRYLLPAMPALAILLALAWERIARWVFVVTLAAEALALALVGLLAVRLEQAAPAAASPTLWALLAVSAVVILAGLVTPALTRSIALGAVFLAYLGLALLLRPFDGPAGRYDARARASVRGRQVEVPYDFIAKEERYRFLLPGANVVGYPEPHGSSADPLMARSPLVVVQLPLHASTCAACTVLGRRLDLRGRQTAPELREIVSGRLSPALLVEELLVQTPAAAAATDGTVAGVR